MSHLGKDLLVPGHEIWQIGEHRGDGSDAASRAHFLIFFGDGGGQCIGGPSVLERGREVQRGHDRSQHVCCFSKACSLDADDLRASGIERRKGLVHSHRDEAGEEVVELLSSEERKSWLDLFGNLCASDRSHLFGYLVEVDEVVVFLGSF